MPLLQSSFPHTASQPNAFHRLIGAARTSSLIACIAAVSLSAHAIQVTQTNLVTDDQSVNPAKITDLNLVNAWGIAHSATSPFWVSANGTDTAELYSVNPVTNATARVAAMPTVHLPGGMGVTGQVFNGTAGAFHGDTFLFVGEDGTIAGWRGALVTTAETLKPASPTDLYKGAAIATVSGTAYLYSANFRAGTIDVLNGTTLSPGTLAGTFKDPTLPTGYAPFNIKNLNGLLYVSYAQQGAGDDEMQGPGLGLVSVFTTDGVFVRRVASDGGALNAPWGMAIAPSSFREFAGDLLVGNFGDGLINVFSSSNDAFLGALMNINGSPVMIDGLWDLVPGDNGNGGSSQSIYFSAGPADEAHGLFGVIEAVPEPGTIALVMLGLGVGLKTRYSVRRSPR